MEILSARRRASTIGCDFVGDAAMQAKRDHAIVGKLPDPSLWIPRPHQPASPGRGLPCRQRRCVTRRSGLGPSEACGGSAPAALRCQPAGGNDEPGSRNVPIPIRRAGNRTTGRRACGSACQALQPIAIRHRAPHRELVVRFGGAVLPHGDRLQSPAAYPGGFSDRSRLSRRRLRTRPAPSPGGATPSRSFRRPACRAPAPGARRCRPDRDPAGAAPPPSSCSRP